MSRCGSLTAGSRIFQNGPRMTRMNTDERRKSLTSIISYTISLDPRSSASSAQSAANSLVQPGTPGQRRIAHRDEIAVEQGVALVVAERPTLRIEQCAAGGFEDGLSGAGVPLAGRAEARVDVHRAFGQTAELERRAQADGLDFFHPRHQRFGARVAVRATGGHAQGGAGRRTHACR